MKNKLVNYGKKIVKILDQYKGKDDDYSKGVRDALYDALELLENEFYKELDQE